MISISKLATNKCATLQGLKYGAISQNDYGSNIQIKMYRFVPYKTYSNKIKVIKKYENKIKG